MKKLLILLIVLFPLTSIAENSGPRSITQVGCHRYNNVCYVAISGDPVGPEGCSSISVRWNKNEANGEAILTLATSAFYADKQVKLSIPATCFVTQDTFPTLSYLTVLK